jgi:predicted GH43/DUF377 family glycosyl hydrolase
MVHSTTPLLAEELTAQVSQLGGEAGLWPDPDEPGWVFSNSSVARYEGKVVVARRKSHIRSGSVLKNWRDNCSVVELSFLNRDDNSLQFFRILEWPEKNGTSLEDPRLHVVQGSLELWCAAWRVENGMTTIRQVIFEFDSQLNLKKTTFPDFGGNAGQHYEKNWCAFGDDSFFIYSISPTQVIFNRHSKLKYQGRGIKVGGEVRMHGGTPAVDLGEDYLTVCQSSEEIPYFKFGSLTVGGRFYSVWAYTFSKIPPFNVLAVTPFPILSSSFKNPIYEGSPAVLFPGGLMRVSQGKLMLAFGVNDCKSAWAKISVSSIRSRLVRVEELPNDSLIKVC